MADDDVIDNDFDGGIEPDLDVDVDELDEEDLEVVVDDDAVLPVDDDEVLVADPAIEVDEEPAPRGRKKVVGDEEVEDDDEVADPDDVEADLDAILKVRIAAADDDEDEDEAEVIDKSAPETPDGVTPKKANEFVCTGCFLLVNRGQFGPADNMTCPVGEADCPAIVQLSKVRK
ncbi:MAG: DUF4193 family protein [Acidimicrobiales bacterium]